MKPIIALLFVTMSFAGFAQKAHNDAAILKSILAHYYKNEKVIVKGRNQLLFLYCEKSNNNEEIFETVNKLGLSKNESAHIKKQVLSDTAPEAWESGLNLVFESDASRLKEKINACLTLEQYQEKQQRFNLNNQRLMIVSKPVYYFDGKKALVKVVFYRSIEHNSGSVLLFEKTDGGWTIKDFLNPWAT